MEYDKFINCNPVLRSTLKITSLDKENKDYMTESQIPVINFDDYKGKYIKNKNLPLLEDKDGNVLQRNIRSNDAIFVNEEDIYFIEFKNGVISNKDTFIIHTKIYDSILILLDELEETIEFCRKHLKYILVYNENKKHKANSFNSSSMRYIESAITSLGSKEHIQFNLHKFKDLYLNEVHTYTKNEFERKFVNKYKHYNMFNVITETNN